MSERTPTLPTAVLDCNVYAQALIKMGGPAGRVVSMGLDGQVRLVIPEVVIREIRELPAKLARRLKVTEARVDRFLVDLLEVADLVRDVPPAFGYDRDPDDAAYVDLAIAAGAGYLVTRDRDLLDLSADTPDGRVFAARFPTLQVLDPVAFLTLLREDRP